MVNRVVEILNWDGCDEVQSIENVIGSIKKLSQGLGNSVYSSLPMTKVDDEYSHFAHLFLFIVECNVETVLLILLRNVSDKFHIHSNPFYKNALFGFLRILSEDYLQLINYESRPPSVNNNNTEYQDTLSPCNNFEDDDNSETESHASEQEVGGDENNEVMDTLDSSSVSCVDENDALSQTSSLNEDDINYQSETLPTNDGQTEIIERTLSLISHICQMFCETDCANGLLMATISQKHCFSWLENMLNNIKILQNYNSVSEYFIDRFSKDLNMPTYKTLVNSFLRTYVKAFIVGRGTFIYRPVKGVYQEYSADDALKCNNVKFIKSFLDNFSSAANRKLLPGLIKRHLECLPEVAHVAWNQSQFHINTEVGIFNTITGTYTPHTSHMFFNTQKKYCIVPRPVTSRPILLTTKQDQCDEVNELLRCCPSENDLHKFVSLNDNFYDYSCINCEIVSHVLPFYSHIVSILRESTVEFQIKVVIIPSLVSMINTKKVWRQATLSAMSTVCTNALCSVESRDVDREEMFYILPLVRLYRLDVANTVVPLLRKISEECERNGPGALALYRGPLANVGELNEKPNSSLDEYGFDVELNLDWSTEENSENISLAGKFLSQFHKVFNNSFRQRSTKELKFNRTLACLAYLFAVLHSHHKKSNLSNSYKRCVDLVGTHMKDYDRLLDEVMEKGIDKSLVKIMQTVLKTRLVSFGIEEQCIDRPLAALVYNIMNMFNFITPAIMDYLESMSAMYTPLIERKQLLVLHGETSGKSVTISLLNEIHGTSTFGMEEKFNSVRGDVNTGTPGRIRIYNSYLVTVSEMSKLSCGSLKVFLSPDTTNRRNLSTNEYTTVRSISMMVGACNTPPIVKSAAPIGEEIRNRVTVVPLYMTFCKERFDKIKNPLEMYSENKLMPLYNTGDQETVNQAPYLSNLVYSVFHDANVNRRGATRVLLSKSFKKEQLLFMANNNEVYKIMLEAGIYFDDCSELTLSEIESIVTDYVVANGMKGEHNTRRLLELFKYTFKQFMSSDGLTFSGMGVSNDEPVFTKKVPNKRKAKTQLFKKTKKVKYN